MVVGWFSRRRQRAFPRSRRRLPRREFAPVEDIVEQGVLVADVAVRMTVKNDIIMNALKRHVDYDEDQIVAMVREAALEIAHERERDAAHIDRVRDEIRTRGRSAWSEAEYGSDDSATLRHRKEVYLGVAVQMRERAQDEQYLAVTAERARLAAWAEIGDSLKERASQPYYGGGGTDEYRKARDARIQQFIEKDLTALVRQQSERTS